MPEPEVTLDELRAVANSDPDNSEDVHKDQEKSRDILARFRGKNAQELYGVMFKPRESDDSTATLLSELLDEHAQWLESHDCARPSLISSVDDIKFPKSFIC